MPRFFAVAAGALIAVTITALAQPTQPAKPVTVKYSDLDLNTRAGAADMLNRIKWAAAGACSHRPGLLDNRRCIAETVASSVAALNAPLVTEAYSGRTDGRVAGR